MLADHFDAKFSFFVEPVSGLPAGMLLSAHVSDSSSSIGVNTTGSKRLFHQEIASDGPVVPFGEASRRRNIKSKAAFRISEENFHDRFGDTTVNKLSRRTSMRSLSQRIPSRPLNQTSRRCPSRRPAGLDCPVIRRPRSAVLQCVSATFFPPLDADVVFFLVRRPFVCSQVPEEIAVSAHQGETAHRA